MLGELVIRRAEPKDAPEIAAIEAASFDDPWTQESIEHDLQYSETVTYVVAVADHQIVGYVSVQIVEDECDIQRVAVLPEYRTMHVASILLTSLIHFTETMGVQTHYLEVRRGNEAARRLYRKFGFLENGLRKNYYDGKDGKEDAILMTRIGDPNDVNPELQA